MRKRTSNNAIRWKTTIYESYLCIKIIVVVKQKKLNTSICYVKFHWTNFNQWFGMLTVSIKDKKNRNLSDGLFKRVCRALSLNKKMDKMKIERKKMNMKSIHKYRQDRQNWDQTVTVLCHIMRMKGIKRSIRIHITK